MPNGGFSEADMRDVRVAIEGLKVKLEERFYNHEYQISQLKKEVVKITNDLHALQIKVASWALIAGALSSGLTLLLGKLFLHSLGVKP
jgi:hypothetical protein